MNYSKYYPYIIGILLVLLGYQIFQKDSPKAPSAPAIIEQTTSLSTVPKESPEDPDVSLTQTYTAVVNGQKMTAPVKTVGPSGTTGVLKQEVDMTPIINRAIEAERKLLKPPSWELSTGVGVHNGDVYVPVEFQRNYRKDRAWSAEVHLDADKLIQGQLKVSGGELKHTWKF